MQQFHCIQGTITFCCFFSELDAFLLEIDEETQGMQATIYHLQQQLKEARDALRNQNGKSSSLDNDSSTSDLNHSQPSSSPASAKLHKLVTGTSSSTTDKTPVSPKSSSQADTVPVVENGNSNLTEMSNDLNTIETSLKDEISEMECDVK